MAWVASKSRHTLPIHCAFVPSIGIRQRAALRLSKAPVTIGPETDGLVGIDDSSTPAPNDAATVERNKLIVGESCGDVEQVRAFLGAELHLPPDRILCYRVLHEGERCQQAELEPCGHALAGLPGDIQDRPFSTFTNTMSRPATTDKAQNMPALQLTHLSSSDSPLDQDSWPH